MRPHYHFTAITFLILLLATPVWATDYACDNVETCPATVDLCRCDLAEELELTGPEIFLESYQYTAFGGRPNYTYATDMDGTTEEFKYIDSKTGTVIKTPDNPSTCPMRIEVQVTDACGQEQRIEATLPLLNKKKLTIAGREWPYTIILGSTYSASGGTPPYTYNFIGGFVDKDTGLIKAVTSCVDPLLTTKGKISVSDACGVTASLNVALLEGQWVNSSFQSSPSGQGACANNSKIIGDKRISATWSWGECKTDCISSPIEKPANAPDNCNWVITVQTDNYACTPIYLNE